jgi:hypothetical protein
LKVFAVFSREPLFYKRSGSHSFLIFAREGELAFAKQRLATKGDWLLKIR